MMQPRELTILLVAGGTLLTIGLIPSLLDRLQQGILNFSASLSSSLPSRLPQVESEKHPIRLWLAAIGLVLILASLLDIFSVGTLIT
jgi:hypothetical protein